MMNGTYILATGQKAAQTLEKQHELMGAHSIEQLQKAGLKEGMIVWDVGCGTGTMTEYLAKAVGVTGHVYTLDISAEQLDITRRRIEKTGFKNVSFLQGDITNISDLPCNQADIVYSRCVLMHLRDPEAALKQMSTLLKPGGFLSLQESTMSTAHTSIPNNTIKDYFHAMISLGQYKGVDFNIGRNLPNFCEKLGLFSKIDSYISQDKLDAATAKQMLLSRLDEWRDKAIKAKVACDEQITNWKNEIECFPENDPTFIFLTAEQTHILAKK